MRIEIAHKGFADLFFGCANRFRIRKIPFEILPEFECPCASKPPPCLVILKIPASRKEAKVAFSAR